uniref:WAP domain-containing protein n=1 Tax=Cyprinus carpio TaxID=7962 RepID=A0A8C1S2Z8_CYPCA
SLACNRGTTLTKPGVCPDDKDMIGVCVEVCFGDSSCPNNQKCCSNGCGHHVFCSVTEKPGVCPDDKDMIGVWVEDCFGDGECPDDEKCGSNGCGHQCMAPYRGILFLLPHNLNFY